MDINYEALKKNLIDVVKEFQAKIGYSKNAMRLYYSLDSLERLLDVKADIPAMLDILKDFSQNTVSAFKGIQFSCEGERFCIIVPEDGVELIHTSIPDSDFLKAFLKKIMEHPSSLEEILNVFRRFSNCVKCVSIDNNDDFNYLIYFENGVPDEYRYCLKFEEDHVIYHRFTPKDFEAFGYLVKE